MYRIIKTQTPVSLFSLFKLSTRDTNFTLQYPAVKLYIAMINFVYSSCMKWNSLIDKILERSLPSESGIIIKGSVQNSDLCGGGVDTNWDGHHDGGVVGALSGWVLLKNLH